MDHFLTNFKSRSIGAAISRIIISFIILKDLIIYLTNAQTLFGNKAIVPYEVYTNALGSYNLKFIQFPFYNPTATLLFVIFSLIVCLLFLFGIKKYLSGILLFICLFEFKNRNIYIMDGADNVIWIMLPLLAFVQSGSLLKNMNGDSYKVPSATTSIKAHISALAVLGIIIQLCLIYFCSGLAKAMQGIWQNGTALYYILRMEDFRGSALNVMISKNGFFIKFFTYFTIVWELLFAFLIWSKKTKKVIVPIGMLTHIGIFILMRVDNFSFVMLSFYPLLFSDDELKRIYNRALDSSLFRRVQSFFALQASYSKIAGNISRSK